jgi:hypothetical protein
MVEADAENAAKPKPVFKLSGVCVSKTAGAAALSVMLLSGKVLPWKEEATSVPRGVQRSHGRVSAD